MRQIIIGLALVFASLMVVACGDQSDPAEQRIYLVRHAEKMTGPDPVLTDAGAVRADQLAVRLSDADLEEIHSTDFKRTLLTADPTSKATGLNVELYDPYDLTGFAETLLASGKTALVVGHSNTTPELVDALGGTPGEPIVEATEYDRLYLLTVTDGVVATEILRYGEPTPR